MSVISGDAFRYPNHNFTDIAWRKTADSKTDFQPLYGAKKADLCVVGAGYTGLSTALHASSFGMKVVLLEQGEIGWGGSGRNGGFVVPYWMGNTPSSVEKRLGRELGERLNDLVTVGPLFVADLIRTHKIHCHMRQTGKLMVGRSTSFARKYAQLAEEYSDLGSPVETVNRSDIPRYLNTDYYRFAYLFKDALSLNPLSYAQGLCKAAHHAGAEIHTHSEAQYLRRCGASWIVGTGYGHVQSSSVVVATNAYGSQLLPALRNSFYRIFTGMIASNADKELIRHLLPGGVPFHDTGGIWFMINPDSDGRIVTTQMSRRKRGESTEAYAKPSARKFKRVFPGSKEPEWTDMWRGEICLSRDGMPHVYKFGEDLYAAFGYSGCGVALATLMGREISRFLQTSKPDDCAFPIETPRAVPIRSVVEYGLKRAANFYSRHYRWG